MEVSHGLDLVADAKGHLRISDGPIRAVAATSYANEGVEVDLVGLDYSQHGERDAKVVIIADADANALGRERAISSPKRAFVIKERIGTFELEQQWRLIGAKPVWFDIVLDRKAIVEEKTVIALLPIAVVDLGTNADLL